MIEIKNCKRPNEDNGIGMDSGEEQMVGQIIGNLRKSFEKFDHKNFTFA